MKFYSKPEFDLIMLEADVVQCSVVVNCDSESLTDNLEEDW